MFPEALTQAGTRKRPTSKEWEEEMEDNMARWQVANEIYYGKDRDTKNFPIIPMPDTTPAVRLGILPNSWWEAMYSRTGVSGTYILIIGGVLTMFSKEMLVHDHAIADSFAVVVYIYLLKKFGPWVNKYLEKSLEKNEYLRYTKPLEDTRSKLKKAVDEVEKDLWRKEGQKYVFQAMKENLDLQLEADYRQRLNTVYTNVKKRLDYQLEVQNATRRFEQENMVNWITQNVLKSITPQQEKETLANCIKTLKELAQKQKATA